jgi:hypothetical protein
MGREKNPRLRGCWEREAVRQTDGPRASWPAGVPGASAASRPPQRREKRRRHRQLLAGSHRAAFWPPLTCSRAGFYGWPGCRTASESLRVPAAAGGARQLAAQGWCHGPENEHLLGAR